MSDLPVSTQDVTLYDPDGNPLAVQDVFGEKILKVLPITESGIAAIDVRTLGQKLSDDGRLYYVSSNVFSLPGNINENGFFLFRNPAGSGRTVRLKNLLGALATTSAFSIVVRTYDTPTLTSDGTALTIGRANPAAGSVSTSQVFINPVATAFGTFRQAFAFNNNFSISLFLDFERQIPQAGVVLLTIQKSSAAGVDTTFNLDWGEQDV